MAKLLLTIQILLYLCASFLSVDSKCQTNNDGPDKLKDCVFPFTFKQIKFNGCTTVTDPDDKLWCSTETDESGRHKGGSNKWGYCNEDCPKDGEDNEERQSSGPIPPEDLGTYIPSERTGDCGYSHESGFIVGGKDAKRGKYPFVALIGYDIEYKGKNVHLYACGGALINKRYVITAAHCQELAKQPAGEVVLGEHDLGKDPDCNTCKPVQRFQISASDFFRHEDYAPGDRVKLQTEGNDIALIRLPRVAETDLMSKVTPICLPIPGSSIPTNYHTVIGWGRTNNIRSDSGDQFLTGAHISLLQQLEVPIVPYDKCTENPLTKNVNRETLICAGGEKGEDSCNGDSGGPLVVSDDTQNGIMYLEGIVSFGSSDCGIGAPGIYTKVQYHINWIKEHLKP